jgi:urease accessory protein
MATANTAAKSVRTAVLAGGAGFALSLLSTLPASAHDAAGGSLAGGALHPLIGIDHLLLLVGVGAAASLVDRSLLAFALAGAVLGGALGSMGMALPGAELLAALAVSAVGLLLLRRLRGSAGMPGVHGGGLILAAVALHALLHGQEAPGAPAWWVGAAAASAAVVLGSAWISRRLPLRWTLRLALGLSLAGGLLALAPLA